MCKKKTASEQLLGNFRVKYRSWAAAGKKNEFVYMLNLQKKKKKCIFEYPLLKFLLGISFLRI